MTAASASRLEGLVSFPRLASLAGAGARAFLSRVHPEGTHSAGATAGSISPGVVGDAHFQAEDVLA